MVLPRLEPRQWLVVLLVATLVPLLVGAVWVKGPCVGADWDGFQYERACYTDLIPLYGGRGLDEEQFPYTEAFNEYPVLTGLWMYLTALPATDSASFFVWNAIGLSLLALGVTFVLWRTSERSVHVLWWALAPPLALYAFHNWDLLAVLFAVLGLFAYTRGHPLSAGVFLGLGVAAKVFPVVFLPVLGADLLRRAYLSRSGPWWHTLKERAPWWFSLGAVGAWLTVNLPFIILNRSLWWETYSFHSGRGPTSESHWTALRYFAERWEWDWLLSVVGAESLPTLSPILIVGGVLALTGFVLAGRLGALAGCLGALCVFLIGNQVFSIQYVLWLVLLFVLVPGVPWHRKLFVFLADLFVYLAVFDYFELRMLGQGGIGLEKLALASLLRLLALGLLLYAAVRVRELDALVEAPAGSLVVASESGQGS